MAKAIDLNNKYTNTALFSLNAAMNQGNPTRGHNYTGYNYTGHNHAGHNHAGHSYTGSPLEADARRQTLDWFLARYKSMNVALPNVRLLLAFHTAPSEEVAAAF